MTYDEAFSNGRQHCVDVKADRAIGEYWEQQFCILAAEHGRCFTRHQFRKSEAANAWRLEGCKHNSVLLPDITLWSAPGEHHEIKHKDPTRDGCFGLERYRLDALIWFARETKQSVYYTIHDHSLAGGRDIKTNRIEDWRTSNILDLEHSMEDERDGPSWCNGKKITTPICYWPVSLWRPLEDEWDSRNALNNWWDGTSDDVPF